MATPAELEARLWKALRSDMTLMLGLTGEDDGHTRPMTAIIEEADRGPIWFFTSTDNEIVQAGGGRAVAAFVSKGHDLFATIHGRLTVDTDRATVDRLWNNMVAAWFDGKDDPKLRLLRLDPESARIWENAFSLVAGIKAIFGADPKDDYKDKAASVPLR
ncbi:pyridoxamine 5'-phosphate oxidase family protein [Pseudogemmobacter humi]|uniref:General stress protein 26 n=1 Tax=Pseudogemmobacter humi TaxID=2483812 RepID=A0A3P5X7K6_9RHOB|nr:pyridoxamine 5'-phosphate oxidase family protein [Pseudogemmobacter humi]VDC24327.1 General stress protein 26 [Pseudogemmobacter humi]